MINYHIVYNPVSKVWVCVTTSATPVFGYGTCPFEALAACMQTIQDVVDGTIPGIPGKMMAPPPPKPYPIPAGEPAFSHPDLDGLDEIEPSYDVASEALRWTVDDSPELPF